MRKARPSAAWQRKLPRSSALDQKTYIRHSAYVGSMKETTLREMLANKPVNVIEHAVRGMLPKGALGKAMGEKLFVYAGPDHPHQAQKPEELKF